MWVYPISIYDYICWLVVLTIVKNMEVNEKDDIHILWKKMLETTNQVMLVIVWLLVISYTLDFKCGSFSTHPLTKRGRPEIPIYGGVSWENHRTIADFPARHVWLQVKWFINHWILWFVVDISIVFMGFINQRTWLVGYHLVLFKTLNPPM